MNTNLLKVLNLIIAENGEDILANPARLKSLFSDLAKDEPKPLRMAFGRSLEKVNKRENGRWYYFRLNF